VVWVHTTSSWGDSCMETLSLWKSGVRLLFVNPRGCHVGTLIKMLCDFMELKQTGLHAI
jgi:hypothetical protein